MPKPVSLSRLLEEPITPEDVLAYIKVMRGMVRVRARILDLNDRSDEIEIQFYPPRSYVQKRRWFPLAAGTKHIADLIGKNDKAK